MLVRLATGEDADAIRQIYNVEVLTTTVTFDLVERTEDEQRAWMASHAAGYPIVVAVDGDEVVGFASLSPFRSRPAYTGTVEDSVYVAASHRGKGVGHLLLTEVVRLAAAHGFHTVIGRSVAGNEASVALHQRCGFEIVGTEHEVGRKFGKWLDVVVLQRML